MPTLHDRMFISQRTLEAWVDSGNVDVRENVVCLKKSGRVYVLEPAVKFVSVVPDDRGQKLLGKVLSERRILELGGEILGDSVLFGETAFGVEAGFVGTLQKSADGARKGSVP